MLTTTNSSYEYDNLSIEIWQDNYREASEKTRVDTWKRLAKAAASVEATPALQKKYEDEFYQLFYDDRFVAGGRIMANIGVADRSGTTLFNCFVHHVSDIKLKDCDSLDGIYDMLKAQAKTLKSEGGYGINASWIRPAGSYVKGIQSRTPGVLKFMELWDKSSEVITQGSVKVLGEKRLNEKNKIRKGAQMLVLNVWHPDILDFIVAKQTSGRFTKFNVSVGITEGFMECLLNDGMWDLKYPDTEHPQYKEVWYGDIEDWESRGLPVNKYKSIKASEIWDSIMTSTYNRAEPGVLFLDLYNKLNPLSYAERVYTTNPCGEIGMSTGVCNLGSVNLPMLISTIDGKPEFDFDLFERLVASGVRFLDNINDISTTPLPEYKQSVIEKRRIGLGVMGLGSLHFILGMRYGSQESLDFVEKLFALKAKTEIRTSALLGKEKGSFELFDKNKHFSTYWWKTLNLSDEFKQEIEQIGCMRNSHQSMNAPTGNTGIYAKNVSGGIEPVFSTNGYKRWSIVTETKRRELLDNGFVFPDSNKSEWVETKHMKFAQRNDEQILKGTFEGRNYEFDRSRGLVVESLIEDFGIKSAKSVYSQEQLTELIKNGAFASAQDISVDDHVSILKIAASYTNMSISKTVNVPNDYPFEDFKNVYLKAWKAGIKGVTTYREGTMTVVLETTKNDKPSTKSNKVDSDRFAPRRPELLDCDIYHMQVNGEKWNIFVGMLNGNPYEIFAGRAEYISIPKSKKSGKIKKNGTYNLIIDFGTEDEIVIKDLAKIFDNSTESSFTRTISLSLRHMVPVQFVVEQLSKGADKDNNMFSLSKALMRVLKNYIQDGTKATKQVCVSCKAIDSMIYAEGCTVCTSCSYSKCS